MRFTRYGRFSALCCWFLGILTVCAAGARAEIIYMENFTGQTGKGVIHSTTDLAGVDWTVDTSAASLTASDDWFAVQDNGGNEQFEGRDLDGTATWLSPEIDISHHHSLELSLLAHGVGNFEDTDYYGVAYELDGASPLTIFDYSGVTGSFSTLPEQTVTSAIGTGETLRLLLTAKNNAGNEYFRLDDVQVGGTPLPEPGTTALLILAAVLTVGLKRKPR